MKYVSKSVLRIVSIALVLVALLLLVEAAIPPGCEAACRQDGRHHFEPGRSGYVRLYDASWRKAEVRLVGGIYDPHTNRIYEKNCLRWPIRYIICGNGRKGTAICH